MLFLANLQIKILVQACVQWSVHLHPHHRPSPPHDAIPCGTEGSEHTGHPLLDWLLFLPSHGTRPGPGWGWGALRTGHAGLGWGHKISCVLSICNLVTNREK